MYKEKEFGNNVMRFSTLLKQSK